MMDTFRVIVIWMIGDSARLALILAYWSIHFYTTHTFTHVDVYADWIVGLCQSHFYSTRPLVNVDVDSECAGD